MFKQGVKQRAVANACRDKTGVFWDMCRGIEEEESFSL